MVTPSNTTLALTNESTQPVKLIYALSDHPGVGLAVPQEAVEPGQRIRLTLNTDNTLTEGQQARVRIKTTLADQPELILQVLAQ